VRIGAGARSYLEVHQNANPGWVATLNGHPLPSAQLDGWQQAFIVPAGAGGVITMTFAPATLYHVALGLSALAIACLLGVAVFRRRRRRAQPGQADGTERVDQVGRTGQADPIGQRVQTGQDQARAPHRAAGRLAAFRPWIGPLAIAAAIFLIGGPAVLAVPVLAVIAAFRPRWLPAVSLAAMLAAGVVAATATAPATIGSGAFGPVAQVLALVALAAALYPQPAAARTRSTWQPGRPLPGSGRRPELPPGGPRPPLSIGERP
jgi:arabinofuranan 3-O-arabinosyltransferase